MATEEACRHLGEEKAASLHSKVAKTVKRAKHPHSNLTQDERKAINELKGDRDIMILPADKGKATLVTNSSDYKEKLKNLLDDTTVCEVLKKEITTTYKNRLVKILREWKREGTILDSVYLKIYPTSEDVPNFYGLPTLHEKD